MIYDIIGDIHGQADKLMGLLTQLGYVDNGKYFQPPHNHRAIFVGDFIDRGNQQIKTLETVFNMIDADVADAVMGNHEYNAIAYATKNAMTNDGTYLKEHSFKNRRNHDAFLSEIPLGSSEHDYWLQRFYELPLWLETESAHFIHACWDTKSMAVLSSCLDDRNCLTKSGLQATGQPNSAEYIALERILKGIEFLLPNGLKLGSRHHIRVQWWLSNLTGRPFAEVAQVWENERPELQALLQDEKISDLDFQLTTDKPVFIGHYWLKGTPSPLSSSVACVDYSPLMKGGYLTCYQLDTKNPLPLSADHFVQYIDD